MQCYFNSLHYKHLLKYFKSTNLHLVNTISAKDGTTQCNFLRKPSWYFYNCCGILYLQISGIIVLRVATVLEKKAVTPYFTYLQKFVEHFLFHH